LAESLIELARDNLEPGRFSANLTSRLPGPGDRETITVGWRVRGRGKHRVLKMWLDTEDLTPAWFVEGESKDPSTPDRSDALVFDLPRDAPAATVLLWSLPLTSPSWTLARELMNKNLPLEGEPTRADHRLLRDLLLSLQREGALGAVVPIRK
ncbi:MAG: hypothetical protein ACYTDY_10335, partial [Planctomycetota bacterium]